MRMQILTPDAHCGGCPAGMGFGLGWQVIPVGTETYLMHTGKDEGVATLGYMNLATKSGVVILTNSDDGMKTVLPILDRLGRDREFVAVLREMAK
jgi:CubicO group peptidase (beta-lactamase class C family)